LTINIISYSTHSPLSRTPTPSPKQNNYETLLYLRTAQ
jgi:hypothetical protein